MESRGSVHKHLEENKNSIRNLDKDVVVVWQNIWLYFAHILKTWAMLSLKEIVCSCLLAIAVIKIMIWGNLGRKGFIWPPDSDYSPSLKEGKAGTQAGQKHKGRKWNRHGRGMLLTGLLLWLAYTAFLCNPGMTKLTVGLAIQGKSYIMKMPPKTSLQTNIVEIISQLYTQKTQLVLYWKKN